MTTQPPGTAPERAPACAECGTRAEPGQSFCDACGAVLDWAGASAPAAAGAARTDGSRGRGTAASGETGPAVGGRQHEESANAGATGGAADGERGWDAFAVSGAGTGTARTAHDSAPEADGRQARNGGSAPDAVSSARPGPYGTGDPGSGPDFSTGADPQRAGTAARGDAADPHPMATDTPMNPGVSLQGNTAAPGDAPGAQGTDVRSGTLGDAERPHAPTPSPSDGGPAATSMPNETAATAPLPSGAPSGDSAAERARSLLIPVADPEPRAAATPSVAPVLPGRPVANRPQVRAPGAEHGEDGGVPCPWCATPNRPERHFCGRCALPMAGGRPAPGQLPWWRRLLNSRSGEIPWAGERPRLRRGFGRVLNWVVGAVVLGLLVFAVMNTGTAVGAVRDHFAKRAPVDPDSVKASRSFAGHAAGLAFDKLNNTWWGPGISQSGEGEWLEARFDQPTRLLDLIITPGVSTRPDQLSQSALPRRIEARVTTADGKTTTRFLTLDRSAGGQRRQFRVSDVTAVRFIIRSSYGAAADKQVSIAEIEFFGRSSDNGS
ncbi:NADase-type glycan-binding domain-containing protein [Streptomyces sp. NBC_00658]|uniref:NADase-type glycan-binding domain-containing protein n=1 Tax=Streptomyces sp. NBC_00658 TaxID=2975800 RepID=UPI003255009A